ncbi:MAG: ATP-binding protein [Euryarchaeota archaeon]|nr:ATP-binding protein [Euryarchaeota archaeon]
MIKKRMIRFKMNADDAGERGMDYERVKLLIREGEGLTVEFKEKYTSRIDEDIVAFANSKGGRILSGVADDNTIAGVHLTNDTKIHEVVS